MPELKEQYDVAVVGSGPAGSTLAREVASRGHSVIMIDKQRHPRYKACAGGVTVRASELLDFDISTVVERTVTDGILSYKMGPGSHRTYPTPIAFMVMRARLDQLLARKAVETGVHFLEGIRIERIEESPTGFDVCLPEGRIRAGFLAGADGANSIVAKKLGLQHDREADLALEAEVQVEPRVLRDWSRRVNIDVGVVRGGYGWVFPKGENLSIGVAGLKRHASDLKDYFQRYLPSLGLGDYKVVHFRGHHIPLRKPGSAVLKGRGLLVGDAAGVADPFTGEGIYHAIRSAQLAAPVVAANVGREQPDLSEYQRAVAREMEMDQATAAACLRLFNTSPRLGYFFMKHFMRPWRGACKLLRGESDWVGISRRAGPMLLVIKLLREKAHA